MKLFTSENIKRLDELTIRYEPISGLDLMERAAWACTHAILKHYGKQRPYLVIAGRGNNGGDGLAVARLLSWSECTVEVFVCSQPDHLKPSTMENYNRARQTPGLKLVQLLSLSLLEQALIQYPDAVIIDALYGTGLVHPLTGMNDQVVHLVNASPHPVVSIDIPSGMMEHCMAEDSTNGKSSCIFADLVLTLHAPKLPLLMPQNGNYYSRFETVDIGLHPRALLEVDTPYEFIEAASIQWMLKERKRFAHKGHFGHGLLIAGSYGMMGAAIMAARAALRTGLGLLTVHVPRQGVLPLQISVPEAMLSVDFSENTVSSQPVGVDKYTSLALGCGLGRNLETYVALNELIRNFTHPVIIDADALYALSKHPEAFDILPKYSIITPHPLEFKRLVGEWKSDEERLQLQRDLARKHEIVVVLKGAFSTVAMPDGHVYFNSTGNPGMATAGSGDVLTGMILGFLCQGYAPGTAALLSVYLHGLAGDLAAAKLGQESLLASDIIANIGPAFLKLKEAKP